MISFLDKASKALGLKQKKITLKLRHELGNTCIVKLVVKFTHSDDTPVQLKTNMLK